MIPSFVGRIAIIVGDGRRRDHKGPARVFAREIYSRGYKKSKSGSTRYVHGLRLDPRGRAG